MSQLTYQSDSMKNLIKMIERVAPSKANVLVLGETGTGKSRVAKTIHELSKVKEKNFIIFNCAVDVSSHSLESELFGSESATGTKLGALETATGGTLFLKGIENLPEETQGKLVKVLQEDEFFRVGGTDSIPLKVRLICSSHSDLDQEVSKGKFREDLYYRINTIVVNIPPLRRRKEDVVVLAQEFLKNKSLSEEALKVLEKYDWHGNVRELEGVCLEIMTIPNERISVSDLPDKIKKSQNEPEVVFIPGMTLYDLEKRYILNALEFHEGNKTAAANSLGITIKTLYNKLHEYGILPQSETTGSGLKLV